MREDALVDAWISCTCESVGGKRYGEEIVKVSRSEMFEILVLSIEFGVTWSDVVLDP